VVQPSESSTTNEDDAGTSSSLDSYEIVASEYYDESKHPTCADFRDGSASLLRKVLTTFRPWTRVLCETGCGNSLLCELFLNGYPHPDLRQINLVDYSPTMLRYSTDRWTHSCVTAHVCDARDLPVVSGSVDVLVASLGDPYNDHSFWAEVGRVLAPDGIAIFTTPSYDWATAFRSENQQSVAQFQLEGGRLAQLPSLILSPDEQSELIEGSDPKLVLEDQFDFRIRQLGRPRSGSKVMPERGPDASVVTCYVVRPV
jgi:SAM-dependent methyltransferase